MMFCAMQGSDGRPIHLFGGDSYGRPEWTRTIDLFRVKVRLTHTPNNFQVPRIIAKPL